MSVRIAPYTLDMRNAVAYTNLSKATLNREVARGELPKLKVRGKTLFRLVDLRKLIDGKK